MFMCNAVLYVVICNISSVSIDHSSSMIDLCVSVYDRYINGGSRLSYHPRENVTPMVPCSLTLVLWLLRFLNVRSGHKTMAK